MVAFGRWLGVGDGPILAPVELQILIDPTPGAPGDLAAATEMLDQNLPLLVRRPRSAIRVWILGKDVASTVEVGSQTVGIVKRGGLGGRKASEHRFVESARSYFVQALRPYYREVAARRSPILEAIGKMAMSSAQPGFERVFGVVSDGREVSAFGDFECGQLPNPVAFASATRRHSVLPPGSLRGVSVVFSLMRLDPVDLERCVATLERQRKVQSLWQAALGGAGASRVSFTSGNWTLDGFVAGAQLARN